MTPTCGWCRRVLPAANSRGYCRRRCEDLRRWHGAPRPSTLAEDALTAAQEAARTRARAALGSAS